MLALSEFVAQRLLALSTVEVGRGQDKGAFRDEPARDLAIAFWVAAHGYVELVLRRRLPVKSEAVAVASFEKLLTPFLVGLSQPRRAARKDA